MYNKNVHLAETVKQLVLEGIDFQIVDTENASNDVCLKLKDGSVITFAYNGIRYDDMWFDDAWILVDYLEK